MKKRVECFVWFCIVACLVLLTACPTYEVIMIEKKPVSTQENPYPWWNGGFASDQFWWGTWQRMDNGNLYEISEDKVRVYTGTNTSPLVTYDISDTSTDTSLVVTSLGTYKKTSDRIIELNDIPYFRKGGSNLDFSLKLVGHVQERSADSNRAASSTSNRKVLIRDKNHPSYLDTTTSDDDGLVKATAPVAGDEMSLAIEKENGGVVVVSGIKVDFAGANVGTVPIVEENQYALKVTGVIENKDKTDGYLYADFAEYPLTLTITNISDVDCPTSMYEITSDDSHLTVESIDSNYELDGILPTIPKEGSLTIKLKIKCSTFDTAILETGVKVKVSASNGLVWNDFVPVKFHKGLYPINISAVTNAKNDSSVLNGFVIYPDNNTKFFIVDQSITGRTIFVPSFDEDEHYMLVFSGATASKILSSSTEMFYTVAPGRFTSEVVAIPSKSQKDLFNEIVNFGEGTNKNDTEDTAFSVNDSFEAFIGNKDKDFYELTMSNDLIIAADRVPNSYWTDASTGVNPVESNTAIYLVDTKVFKGTFASVDSWIIYSFKTTSGSSYKVEWGDSDNTLSATYDGETDTYTGSADIEIAYNTSSMDFDTSTYYSSAPLSITGSSSSNFACLKVRPKSSSNGGGTFSIRVTNSSSEGQSLNCEKSSGYVGDSWQEASFENNDEEHIYYYYLYTGWNYTLRWSDYWEGFGHSADIKVSASTDIDDFTTASNLYFSNENNGYLEGQKFTVDKNGYVFFKFSPNSKYSRFKGSYAFNMIRQEPDADGFYTMELKEYNSSTFECYSGANARGWSYGRIYPDGYEIVKFPVIKDRTYTVFWDDSTDGSGSRDADIEVSAYGSYSASGDLSNEYWVSQDKGYSHENLHSVTANADGYVFLKVRNKENADGLFRITVMYGPDGFVPLISCKSHNNNFGNSIPENIKTSDFYTGTLYGADSMDVYYFKTDPNKVYKLYGLDSSNSSNTASIYGDIRFVPLTSDDDNLFKIGSEGLSLYSNDSVTEYVVVLPNEKSADNAGSYGIVVTDGDNNPINLTKFTADSGEKLPSDAWLTGELTSQDETIVYSFVTKPYTYTKIFFDDKGSGSGNYTADIEISFGAINEDDLYPKVFDKSFAKDESIYCFTDSVSYLYYIKVSAKDSSASNIGTFAIAVMEGNEKNTTFKKVSPNASVIFSPLDDIELTSAVNGNKRTYTATSGFSEYKWYVDGVLQASTTNTLEVDTSTKNPGVYEILVEVSDGTNYYSACDFLKVE